jgi:hypothetical protein
LGARGRGAGDVVVLLLDKTGTITLGNRQAPAFLPTDILVDLVTALASGRDPHAHQGPRTAPSAAPPGWTRRRQGC